LKSLPKTEKADDPTETLPIAKFVSNEQLIAEEKFLASKESEIERRYAGSRGRPRCPRFVCYGKLAPVFISISLKSTKTAVRRNGAKGTSGRLTRALWSANGFTAAAFGCSISL
jgi:hypothetical protein